MIEIQGNLVFPADEHGTPLPVIVPMVNGEPDPAWNPDQPCDVCAAWSMDPCPMANCDGTGRRSAPVVTECPRCLPDARGYELTGGAEWKLPDGRWVRTCSECGDPEKWATPGTGEIVAGWVPWTVAPVVADGPEAGFGDTPRLVLRYDGEQGLLLPERRRIALPSETVVGDVWAIPEVTPKGTIVITVLDIVDHCPADTDGDGNCALCSRKPGVHGPPSEWNGHPLTCQTCDGIHPGKSVTSGDHWSCFQFGEGAGMLCVDGHPIIEHQVPSHISNRIGPTFGKEVYRTVRVSIQAVPIMDGDLVGVPRPVVHVYSSEYGRLSYLYATNGNDDQHIDLSDEARPGQFAIIATEVTP